LGANPLGFGDTIVLLTAVHFHYAGFVVSILAGMAGRALVSSTSALRSIFRLAAAGIGMGVPLVALGITFSRVLEVAAVFTLAASLVLLALLGIFGVLPRLRSRLARALLAISAAAAIWTMSLSVMYATGAITGHAITIPQMALAHGAVNAFGLALCGLLAWTIERGQAVGSETP
jgi:hypothetical protein